MKPCRHEHDCTADLCEPYICPQYEEGAASWVRSDVWLADLTKLADQWEHRDPGNAECASDCGADVAMIECAKELRAIIEKHTANAEHHARPEAKRKDVA